MTSTEENSGVGTDGQKFMLRELPHGTVCYLSTYSPLSTFIALQIYDKTPDATKSRVLPLNEKLALALNELAVESYGGFFQHLPNRDMISKVTERHILSDPGPNYAALIYMKFTWSTMGRQRFMTSTHRTRYMASDYLANRPWDATPISCFQVAAHKTYPLFRTSHNSYIIIVTSTFMYLLTTQQLESIVGRWNTRKRNPSGLDRTYQLETFPGLWKDDPSYNLWSSFTPFRINSLDVLYNNVREFCSPLNSTSGELFGVLPRPAPTQQRICFGMATNTNAQDESPVAELAMKSRRGEVKQPKKPKSEVADRAGSSEGSENFV